MVYRGVIEEVESWIWGCGSDGYEVCVHEKILNVVGDGDWRWDLFTVKWGWSIYVERPG